MLCKKYESLSPIERITLIGSVIHCLQNDDKLFDVAIQMKELGLLKGLFEGVVINPSSIEMPEGIGGLAD